MIKAVAVVAAIVVESVWTSDEQHMPAYSNKKKAVAVLTLHPIPSKV